MIRNLLLALCFSAPYAVMAQQISEAV